MYSIDTYSIVRFTYCTLQSVSYQASSIVFHYCLETNKMKADDVPSHIFVAVHGARDYILT